MPYAPKFSYTFATKTLFVWYAFLGLDDDREEYWSKLVLFKKEVLYMEEEGKATP